LSYRGIRGGDACEKDRQETKSKKGPQGLTRPFDQDDGEETRQACGEKTQERREIDAEEGRQEIIGEIGEGAQIPRRRSRRGAKAKASQKETRRIRTDR
jgi:hypothetical protein